MQWSGHPYLLCEEIAESVREPLAVARARGLLAHFDYEGAMPVAREEGHSVKALAERLATSAVRSTHAGSVSFLARVSPLGAADCVLHLQVLSTASMLSADAEHLLQHTTARPDGADAALTSFSVVRALCGAMRGRFSYRSAPAGSLVDIQVPIPCLAPLRDTTAASAEGAQAWLIGDDPRVHGLLPRRLERLDWSVRLVRNEDSVDASLAERGPGASPALIVASTGKCRKAWVQGLRHRVSPQTQLFYVADPTGSPTPAIPGVCIQRPPFSPRQLAHITHMAQVGGLRPSGDTTPAPLTFANRPCVLLVEPNDVNAAIVQAELFAAGFEVDRISQLGELRRALQGAIELAVVNTQSELPAQALAAITGHLRDSASKPGQPLIGTCFDATARDPVVPFDRLVHSAQELGDLLYRSGSLNWMQLQ